MDMSVTSSTHLPHARGDEPDRRGTTALDARICPTHVGMNRKAKNTRRCRANLPHARGDEPQAIETLGQDSNICPTHVGMNRHILFRHCENEASAPRTWG